MKCQKCNKQATFHITEMIDAQPIELHFCQEHAYEYLHQSGAVSSLEEAAQTFSSLPLGQGSGSQEKVGGLRGATDELTTDDFQMCPCCHTGFQDFRRAGLFGCPNDYEIFSDRLGDFLLAMHGSTTHVGKRPRHQKGGADVGATLVHLRTLLEDAIELEDYERASTLRDRIASIESNQNSEVASSST